MHGNMFVSRSSLVPVFYEKNFIWCAQESDEDAKYVEWRLCLSDNEFRTNFRELNEWRKRTISYVIVKTGWLKSKRKKNGILPVFTWRHGGHVGILLTKEFWIFLLFGTPTWPLCLLYFVSPKIVWKRRISIFFRLLFWTICIQRMFLHLGNQTLNGRKRVSAFPVLLTVL